MNRDPGITSTQAFNMLLKLFAFCLLFSISPISYAQQERDLIEEQRMIVGTLSGHRLTSNGQQLGSRSNKRERQEAREYLLSILGSIDLEGKLQTYEFKNIHPLIDLAFDPFVGANVYGILNATTASDEYIVIGAHYDTERNCPGAIDNGTGVAIIYSVLNKLRQETVRKKNVIGVFFDQEEEDLIGSQAFAAFLTRKKWKIHSVHTFDTIGWDRDQDKAVELELPSVSLEKRYRMIAAEMGIPVYATKVNSTDHHSFRQLGFNVTGMTDELVGKDFAPYKDTPGDTYDTVNFEYLASSTSLVFQVINSYIKE